MYIENYVKDFCHYRFIQCGSDDRANDYYFNTAFETIADFFTTHPNIDWLKGLDVIYNEKGIIVNVNLPIILTNQYSS